MSCHLADMVRRSDTALDSFRFFDSSRETSSELCENDGLSFLKETWRSEHTFGNIMDLVWWRVDKCLMYAPSQNTMNTHSAMYGLQCPDQLLGELAACDDL